MTIVRIGRWAKPGMGSVNTYWIESDEGLIVIDGQREISSAKAALEEMTSGGKTVLAVFLTHPHPDHFGGIGVFAPEGTDIPVYGSAQTRESMREDRWGLVKLTREVVGDDLPAAFRLPDRVLADGQPVEVGGVTMIPGEMGGGEAECMTVLHLPEQHALFAADVIQDRMTAFLLEGRSRAWLAQLHAVKTRYPSIQTVYPGHGAPGPFAELIDRQIEYLETFRDLVAEHGPDGAAAAMKTRYPGYQPVAANPQLLEDNAAKVAGELHAERA